jgi:L-ascorbate metabolism protein UlaG (beta-lactamase superfamily)
MEITYLGHSCFKISGKKINILTDPFDPKFVGLKLTKQDADVVTISHAHPDHNYTAIIKNEDYLVLDSPGEYEVKESEFVGVEASHGIVEGIDKGKITMFSFEVDGVKIAHLGDLGTELNSAQLDCLDGVDVLLIPVGGYYTIDAKIAVKVISQVEPKIIIPMHFKSGQSIPGIEKLSPLETFLHEMTVTPIVQDKLKLTVKDLPLELQVVSLKVV